MRRIRQKITWNAKIMRGRGKSKKLSHQPLHGVLIVRNENIYRSWQLCWWETSER
jgi:hypothetical protein